MGKIKLSDASDTHKYIQFGSHIYIQFGCPTDAYITADRQQFVKFEARNGGSMRPAPRMAEKIPLSELEKP